MATLQERNKSFRILFVHNGRRHTFTLGRVPLEIAEAKVSKVDEILALLRGGYIAMPPSMNVVTFMEHDGKVPVDSPAECDDITLGRVRDEYLKVPSSPLLITLNNRDYLAELAAKVQAIKDYRATMQRSAAA